MMFSSRVKKNNEQQEELKSPLHFGVDDDGVSAKKAVPKKTLQEIGYEIGKQAAIECWKTGVRGIFGYTVISPTAQAPASSYEPPKYK